MLVKRSRHQIAAPAAGTKYQSVDVNDGVEGDEGGHPRSEGGVVRGEEGEEEGDGVAQGPEWAQGISRAGDGAVMVSSSPMIEQGRVRQGLGYSQEFGVPGLEARIEQGIVRQGLGYSQEFGAPGLEAII